MSDGLNVHGACGVDNPREQPIGTLRSEGGNCLAAFALGHEPQRLEGQCVVGLITCGPTRCREGKDLAGATATRVRIWTVRGTIEGLHKSGILEGAKGAANPRCGNAQDLRDRRRR